MLRQLSIRDIALIEALDLEFDAGFTVLTGETGAGKSIVIESLSLALGGRADSALVREGAPRCTVIAEFEALPQPAIEMLDAMGINSEQCIVKRQVSAEGRSRAFINGEPVAVNSLRELGELLVDIHGQHAHHALLRRQVQREMLDARADNGALLDTLAQVCAELDEVRDAMDQLGGDPEEIAKETERLRFELDELEADDYTPTAMDALQADHRRLAGMGSLIEAVDNALATISTQDGSAEEQLADALRCLRDAQDLEPELKHSAALIDEALINLTEAGRSLRSLQADFETNPGALAELENRLSRAHTLARKHRVEITELGEMKEQLNARLEMLGDADGRRAELAKKETGLLERYRQCADEVHERRESTANIFAEEVTTALEPLGMAGARFAVALDAKPGNPPSPHGYDSVEFQFSGNAGTALRPLAKAASGGELSRASLAIEIATLGRSQLPSIVFDEVDVGIGGRVAAVVGQKLRELGEQTQVFCITHLAQVAALGHQHYRVAKSGEPVRVEVSALNEKARCEEVARMLGGLEITRSTLAHARELIAAGE